MTYADIGALRMEFTAQLPLRTHTASQLDALNGYAVLLELCRAWMWLSGETTTLSGCAGRAWEGAQGDLQGPRSRGG